MMPIVINARFQPATLRNDGIDFQFLQRAASRRGTQGVLADLVVRAADRIVVNAESLRPPGRAGRGRGRAQLRNFLRVALSCRQVRHCESGC